MKPPQRVLDAIRAVSWTIPCLDCGGTVGIHYSEAADAPVIRHYMHHDLGPAADALAETVLEELQRHVLVADYGEARPVHLMASR